VIQASILCQIPGGAEELDQLEYEGKTLCGSSIEIEAGHHRFVALIDLYARAFSVAQPEKGDDTRESSERNALQKLLSSL
jgi:hypothetical protein